MPRALTAIASSFANMTPFIAALKMLPDNFPVGSGAELPNQFGGWRLWQGRSAYAQSEITSALAERYRSSGRFEKGRILNELCAVTGWHRKHAVRALRRRKTVGPGDVEASEERKRRYGATVKDAMTALWEASDRVCGKRLKVMIPTLLPALEQHGRLQLGQSDRDRVLAIGAATIDRLLVDVKIAASGGRRRRAGFYSAIRREARSAHSMTGTARCPASARSIWSPTAVRRWLARSSKP